jgi:hypothetical protein
MPDSAGVSVSVRVIGNLPVQPGVVHSEPPAHALMVMRRSNYRYRAQRVAHSAGITPTPQTQTLLVEIRIARNKFCGQKGSFIGTSRYGSWSSPKSISDSPPKDLPCLRLPFSAYTCLSPASPRPRAFEAKIRALSLLRQMIL